MFEAQMLMATGTDCSVYSPWFARGGDNLRATLDAIKRGTAATVTVSVYTKKNEDRGDGEDADPSTSIRITGGVPERYVAEWLAGATTGPKNLVRYKFTVTGAAGDWILFRMLTPVWFDSVNA